MSIPSKQEIINVMTPIIVRLTGMDEDEVESKLGWEPKEINFAEEFAYLDETSSEVIEKTVRGLGYYIGGADLKNIHTFYDLIVYINKVSDIRK
ncbi:hypothetical protein [Pseudomonas lundensis]|uniref:hypothetical protein n=1 Tax=Pseudomonas lundensis TaxID=86185 RepID=UPI00111308DD|nr:hypothetical protein [Pseudomonas lundensis]